MTCNNNKNNNLDSKLSDFLDSTQRELVLKDAETTKQSNIKFSDFIEDIDDIMSDKVKTRIGECGSFLEFLGDAGLEHIKLNSANFCDNRFCPQCSQNKARKDALQLATMCMYIKQELDLDFIFLTLTAPNIDKDDIQKELKDYMKSFERLFKYKAVAKICKGYARKLEMTYNSDSDTYHPHYHVMIAVNKSYFTDKNYYISQKAWLSLWQKAKRDKTITQVDIRKFKNNDDTFKAIFELTKYIAKDSDYMHSEDVFKVFYKALKGKRMLSYSGVFKKAVELYKAGDLDYLIEDPAKYIEWVCRVWYSWNGSGYEIKNFAELTEDEKQKANLSRVEKTQIKKQEELEILKQNEENAKARKVELQKISARIESVRRERLEKISPEVDSIIRNYRLNKSVFEILINNKSEKLSNVDVLNNSRVLKSMPNSVQNPLEEISYKLAGIEKLKILISKNKL